MDQVVVITGASRGIGEAAARVLAADGAKLVLAARSLSKVEQIAQEIGATAVACDVSRYQDVADLISAAEQLHGRVDVLVNNAGMIEPVEALANADVAAWDNVIDVNLKGVFYGMRAAIPGMVARGGGTVINISSGAAYNVLEGWSHYCASKAGVLQLTRSGHLEYGAAGVRVMGLSPGTVATQMQKEIKASGVNPVSELAWDDHIPPEWVGRAIAYLSGPGGDAYLGQDMKLREPEVRAAIGLT